MSEPISMQDLIDIAKAAETYSEAAQILATKLGTTDTTVKLYQLLKFNIDSVKVLTDFIKVIKEELDKLNETTPVKEEHETTADNRRGGTMYIKQGARRDIRSLK